ncbi:GntR family transcriptional regulator [Lactiplantibacillus paraplantarum]|uniref:GntR family transcriptional regulator n=1 Tax=Lactiplantibacillus paraplantarum TaxID=60520 RepID=A0ABQ0NBV0_9LACO|nr:GntR family transcriptional regulator [Lactiplantibacillus paraplantarum]ERL45829.1 transcriptional regulator, GntR family protein [Lactiplantibacillus paraplantarum]MCU4685164.1 GntR family transcriptional regulator [Lactiplantibacillus paraplantarum]QJU50858.1 HTH-type transcriptional regulator FrlR [Lactiplantibacillus paraplantarum]UKB40353.1 GntR family transcriptional regulator [Lactiplantibacillus paraplantarum]GBF02568.1 GntR family transcriptional regulator [Lactiplantibacillus par
MQLKYQQVEQFLLYQLKNGDFKEGDKFYSEAELKKRFDVSSATVIKAINELVSKGLLVRQQGKGTFVSRARRGKLVKFFDLEKDNDADETVTVLSIKREHDPRILKELNLASINSYFHIIRLRCSNNTPVQLHHTYLVSEYFNQVALKEPSYYESIYEKIRQDSGIDLFSTPSDETTGILFPAPQQVKTLLQLQSEQQPIAYIRRHSYLFDDKAIEYVESYKRWDYFKIQIKTV